MVLVVLSSCKATSPTPPTSAPATNTQAAPTPTAEEVFHLRSECARLAEKMLESNKKRDRKRVGLVSIIPLQPSDQPMLRGDCLPNREQE